MKPLHSFYLLAMAMSVTNLLHAQPLPGESVYHLQATLQSAEASQATWASLRGKPRVVSMIYSNCHLMCPLIVENAKSVQKQLTPEERSRLELTMVSLDPARDTPQALHDMAERHRVSDGWLFLAPAENDVRAIAAMLGVRYRFRDDGSINHTSVLILLDAEGRERARSEVTNATSDPQFVQQVKALLAEPR